MTEELKKEFITNVVTRLLSLMVCEPNDESTRLQVKLQIEAVLESLKATKLIYDYQVHCDERQNSPDVIERNQLAAEIGIKFEEVASFIAWQFTAFRKDTTWEEVLKHGEV